MRTLDPARRSLADHVLELGDEKGNAACTNARQGRPVYGWFAASLLVRDKIAKHTGQHTTTARSANTRYTQSDRCECALSLTRSLALSVDWGASLCE